MSSVYLETSFFSECCTIRTGDIARGRRASSLLWWQNDAHRYELFISNEVVRELSSLEFSWRLPMNPNDPKPEETGVADVRRVREAIARQHKGNLADHVAESNRIADALRAKLRLGPTVQPPTRSAPKSGTEG
jgi:hypothetical protein